MAAAITHDELAAQWEADGDRERADLERRKAELERTAAQLERDRAALAGPRRVGPGRRSGRDGSSVMRETRILRAVDILRGTSYDYRVEATIEVAALFGQDVLVAALESLDAEIEPHPRRKAARRPSRTGRKESRERAQ